MTTLKFIPILLLIGLCSCKQQPAKHKTNPEVLRLNNKIIPLVLFTDNPDSCRKALLFLDSATAIDSNNFLTYDNKLMYHRILQHYFNSSPKLYLWTICRNLSVKSRFIRLKAFGNVLRMELALMIISEMSHSFTN